MNSIFITFLDAQRYPCSIATKIIPNAPKTSITSCMDDGTWKIKVAAIPEKGKANKELKRFFWKEYGLRIEIIKGEHDHRKVLRMEKIQK